MAASTQLASLDELKRYLSIEGSSHDTFLGELLDRASEAIERYTGRIFGEEEVSEDFDGLRADSVVLKKRPVKSVASVKDDPDREFGAETEIDSDDYVVGLDSGIIRLLHRTFSNAVACVRVAYTAGMDQVPDDVVHACVLLAAHWFNRASEGADGFESERFGERAADYDSAGMPDSVRKLLEPFAALEI